MFCLICCVPPSLRRIWWVLVSLDQLYHGSNWAMMYGNIGILNQMFLEFLVATVYSEIQRVLAENGIDMSARDAIYAASQVELVMTLAGNLRSGVDRSADRIMRAFGIDVFAILSSELVRKVDTYRSAS